MSVKRRFTSAIIGASLAVTGLGVTSQPASATLDFAEVEMTSANFCSNIDRVFLNVMPLDPNSAAVLDAREANQFTYSEIVADLYDGSTDLSLRETDSVWEFKSGSRMFLDWDVSNLVDPKVKVTVKYFDENYLEFDSVVTTVDLVDIYVPYAGGTGTEADPYRITNSAQLQAIACHTFEPRHNIDTLDDQIERFKLINNIDLGDRDEVLGWQPIGVRQFQGGAFSGRFLGNNKTIKNLTINTPGLPYTGLFSDIRTGEVEDLVLENFQVLGGNRVAALAGSTYGFTFDNINVKSSSVTGYENTGLVIGEAERGDLTNVTAHGDVNISGSWNSSPRYFGGLVGNAEYTSVRRADVDVDFAIAEAFKNARNTAGDYATESEVTVQNIGGIYGYLDDGSDAQNIALDVKIDADNLNRAQYWSALVGESDSSGSLRDISGTVDISISDIARIDAVVGLVAYPKKLSMQNVVMYGKVDLAGASIGYSSANFGNAYEAATLTDIYTDIDLTVDADEIVELGHVIGVIQKSRIQNSVFAGDTSIVTRGGCSNMKLGVFAGRQQSHGGFNKVVVTGKFEYSLPNPCEGAQIHTSFGSIQTTDAPMFRDSFWGSQRVESDMPSIGGLGHGATNKELASEKFWVEQGFDMTKDFAVNAQGQLVPRAAISLTDESQASPKARVAFGKVLKSGKRGFNVNLENKYAFENATVRLVRGSTKIVIKRVVLSRLGNAMFVSKNKLQAGDKLQVAVNGKTVVNYVVR